MTDRRRAPGTTLRNGPSLLYPAKAVFTRLRSGWWLTRGARRPATTGGLRILTYHRVSDDTDELAVRPRRFREQMDFLAAEGFRVIDVAGVERLLARSSMPARTIGLSFDDGYLDVAEQALPVLEQHGFTASVFLASHVIDRTAGMSWYRTSPPLLEWDDVGRLDRAGTLRFEPHSRTHPNLLQLAEQAARDEISGSKSDLELRLGRGVSVFCYPAGLFGERERRLVREAGFAAAVSCEPGVNVPSTDRFALRRRQIDPRDSLLDFRAKVAGGHDSPPPLRGLYRRRYGAGSPRTSSSPR